MWQKNWSNILILSQIIRLILALAFIFQQKYAQAGIFLIFGGAISSKKNNNYTIKFLNKIIIGIAIIISIHWLYLKIAP